MQVGCLASLDVRCDIPLVHQNVEKYDLVQNELGLICGFIFTNFNLWSFRL